MDNQNLGGQPEQAQPQMQQQPSAPQPIPQVPQQSQEQAESPKAGKLKEMWTNLLRFLRECQRVLKVTQKPNKEEFITTAKVSAIGLAVIGLIGFALSMIQQLIL